MFAVIISILVVLVIIIVVAAAWTLSSSGDKQTDKSDKAAPATQDTQAAQAAQEPAKKLVWRRFYDINFTHGDRPAPRKGSPDGSVTFAGDTNDPSQCQKWCEQDPTCLGYSHVGDIGNEWSNQCYLVKNYNHGVIPSPNHQSGWKYYV
jgi:hypothetical protein